MSETLTILKDQITRQQKEIDDLRSENAKRRTTNRDLKADVADLTGKLTAATGKVTELEQAVGKAPADAQARIEELTSEVRGYKHKGVFRDKAGEAGVDPKALDVLWRESGYKADADDVNEDAIAEAITRAKESHPFLFRAAIEGEPTPPPLPRPPLGHDRGAAPSSGTFVVRESQAADPAWKMANQAAFNQAGKNGTLKIVPG